MVGKRRRSGKKPRSCGGNTNAGAGDVTLNDFANSTIPSGKGRVKKAAMTAVEREVKNLNLNDDDRPWDEKLEEMDCDFEFVEKLGEDGKEVVMKRRRRKKTLSKSSDDDKGMEYPLDVWFILSEFICPEDVATFAAICQSTLHVVRSAKFWLNLYKRYYKKFCKLPGRLQPDCIVRHYGLRSCVIRSLYLMYPPFVSKAKAVMSLEAYPHQLIKRQCVLVWHERFKTQWVHCFKLRLVDHCGEKRPRKVNLLEMLDDVYANPEEDCKVLQVTCMNYAPTPMVLGQTLISVSLTLDHNMRCKLQLVFGSWSKSVNDVGSMTVVLNPVMKMRVLDWWHPMYPQSNELPPIANSTIQ